ncbi:hypothetical protein ACNKHW_13880 [Shigella flexneri]
MARFANPALKHKPGKSRSMAARNYRQRIVACFRVHQGARTDWSLLALGVAGWMRCVSGVDDAGNALIFAIRLAIKFANLLRAAAVNNA